MKIIAKKNKIFVEFIRKEKTNVDDIFQTNFSPDKREHYFIVDSVETMEGQEFAMKIFAQEYGYWCNYLQRSDIDVRDMKSMKLTKVIDSDKIKDIHSQHSLL